MSTSDPDPVAGDGGWGPVPASVRPMIASFARETLGCQCPPEVFEQIGQTLGPVPGLPGIVRRIVIGGRLLIHVVEPPGLPDALAGIGRWAREGCLERDRCGLNRFRLVIVLDDPTPETQRLVADALNACTGIADLVGSGFHLHCLSAAALPKDW